MMDISSYEQYIPLILLAFGLVGIWFWLQKKVEDTQKRLQESFKAFSYDIIESNSRSFLNLAQTSMEKFQEGAKADLEQKQKSIDASLKQIDTQMREIEKKREGAYAALTQQIEGVLVSERELRKETAHLVQALRTPQTRGSWGEVHLRRVVELAGLLNNCDFYEQRSLEGETRNYRPDLIVHLPGERLIAVDAKTPMSAYLDASDAGDDLLRKKKLQEHAASLRKHIKDLSAKEYWKQFERAPEFVVLFLPAEAFFSAALQADPTLIEAGADQNVVFATPTTLIAILRAVAFSWKQESLSKSAQEIARLGQELYERLGTLTDHWSRVGKNLNIAVDAYNQSIASLETRVLVSARKLKEAQAITKEIIEPDKVEKIARDLTGLPLR